MAATPGIFRPFYGSCNLCKFSPYVAPASHTRRPIPLIPKTKFLARGLHHET